MTTPMVRIHNTETDEIIDREMNNAELAELARTKSANDSIEAERAKAQADKAALLAKLGITADEAKLLFS